MWESNTRASAKGKVRIPNWASVGRPALASPTAHTVFRILLFILFLATCGAVWKWPASYPHPDIWLGADFVGLGMLGVIVSLRGPVRLFEKVLYASICIFFAILGIKLTIQQSSETAKAEEELKTTLQQVANSTEETRRIEALNTQLQNKLLDQSANISELAKESFRTITGADSFPYVAPQPASYPGPIPLFVWDHGKYMLTGVTLTIRRSNDFSFFLTPLDIGILHPGWGKPLSTAILPKPDPNTGIDIYIIEMYTQSDFFTEIMHFRKGNDGKYWAYKFWVDEAKFGERKEIPLRLLRLPKTVPKNGSITFPVYDRSQWSDEPQDVKRTGK